ncbi:signal transducer and activator of transcription3 [Striga asiatica]|uniref:Signal transducer and activator of transcription3 n=1 Tax=Striga asiatica TaxID=4170 RepID=A0A5A7Q3T5_STRAF|nr:signal transducer and activator of transcription3 [Striga asiatica]
MNSDLFNFLQDLISFGIKEVLSLCRRKVGLIKPRCQADAIKLSCVAANKKAKRTGMSVAPLTDNGVATRTNQGEGDDQVVGGRLDQLTFEGTHQHQGKIDTSLRSKDVQKHL